MIGGEEEACRVVVARGGFRGWAPPGVCAGRRSASPSTHSAACPGVGGAHDRAIRGPGCSVRSSSAAGPARSRASLAAISMQSRRSGAESPAIGLAEVRVAGAAKDQGPAQGDAPMSGPRRGGTLDSWPAIYSTTGTNRTGAAWCSPRSKDTTARFATGRSSPRAAPARTRSGGRSRSAARKTRSGGWAGVAVHSEASAKLPILPWGCRRPASRRKSPGPHRRWGSRVGDLPRGRAGGGRTRRVAAIGDRACPAWASS